MNVSAATVTAHLIHNGIGKLVIACSFLSLLQTAQLFVLTFQVGLDKSETVDLCTGERPIPIQPEPEPVQTPIPASAPKRKSAEKPARKAAKQRKISDYMAQSKNAPQQAQKRKANSNSNAKKVKSSQDECDRQMELMDDSIGVVDLTANVNQPEVEKQTSENNQTSSTAQTAIDFLQKFKMPTKRVFKFVQPTKTLKECNLILSSPCVEGAVDGECDANLSPVKSNLSPMKSFSTPTEPPGNQLVATSNFGSKSLTTSAKESVKTSADESVTTNADESLKTSADESLTALTVNERREEAKSNVDWPTDTQSNKTESENESNANERTEDNRNIYVPSCIKAMFGSQSQILPRRTQSEKIVPRMKDINFRYVILCHHHNIFHMHFKFQL